MAGALVSGGDAVVAAACVGVAAAGVAVVVAAAVPSVAVALSEEVAAAGVAAGAVVELNGFFRCTFSLIYEGVKRIPTWPQPQLSNSIHFSPLLSPQPWALASPTLTL